MRKAEDGQTHCCVETDRPQGADRPEDRQI